MVPINFIENNMITLTGILAYQQGSFAFTYLDLPLSIHKLRMEVFSAWCKDLRKGLLAALPWFNMMEGHNSLDMFSMSFQPFSFAF